MKYLLIILSFLCLSATTMAQQKPEYDRTRTSQVLSDYATRSRYFIGIPSGTTPGFPSYVPDSVKCGALYNKTTLGQPDTLKSYDCNTGTWKNAGAQTYTGSGGIVKVGNNFQLGSGTVGEIILDQTGSDFKLKSTDGWISGYFDNSGGTTEMKSTLNSDPTHSYSYINNSQYWGTDINTSFNTNWQSRIQVSNSTINAISLKLINTATSKTTGFIIGSMGSPIGGISVSDDIGLYGMGYGADYSVNGIATFGSRWIIDKGYADAHYATLAGATYTASNGVTQTGNDFEIGGGLTGNTVINTNGNWFHVNTLSYAFGGKTYNTQAAFEYNNITLTTSNNVDGTGTLILSAGSFNLYDALSGNARQIYTANGSNGIFVKDSRTSLGLVYTNDYSANGSTNPRWIIDKGYADSHYASITPAWSTITGKPTTLAGYGITDGLTASTASSTYLPFTGGTMTGSLTINNDGGLHINTAIGNLGVTSTTNSNLYTAETYNSFEVHNGANNWVSYNKNGIADADGVGNAFYLNYPATLSGGSISVQFRDLSGTVALLSDISSATPAWSSITGKPTTLSGYGITDAQAALSGTGFVKISGTTISYDNSTYLTTSAAASTYASLVSPALTGTPTAPTQATTDNSTALATTAYVQANLTATTVYFQPGLFSGAGTSASPYNLGSGTVGISNLSATGTPSSTTFLAGDNTWKTITSGATYTAGTGIGIASNVISIDQTFTPTWTGAHIWQNNAASSTLTPYATFSNATTGLTASGTTYYSPTLSFLSPVWTGSASSNIEFRAFASTNQSNGFGYFTIASLTGGTGSNNVFLVDNFGNGYTSGSWGVHTTGVATSTTKDGLVALNFTAATSGAAVQNSLVDRYMGAVWNTTSAANNWSEWTTGTRQTSGATPVSTFYWSQRFSTNNSGSYTDLMSLSSAAVLTVGNGASGTNIINNGSNSGTSGGASMVVRNAGTSIIGIGNYSNMVGGTYDATPYIYGSAPIIFSNDIRIPHLRGNTAAPTIAAGSGAGTTPGTLTIVGSDMSGTITVPTGATGTASSAIIVTVTFNTAYTFAPKGIVLTPANAATAALASGAAAFVPGNGLTNGPTTTTFVIMSNGTPLAPSTTYAWTYQVIQ